LADCDLEFGINISVTVAQVFRLPSERGTRSPVRPFGWPQNTVGIGSTHVRGRADLPLLGRWRRKLLIVSLAASLVSFGSVEREKGYRSVLIAYLAGNWRICRPAPSDLRFRKT
jgi:hypothetical protein